MSLQMFIEIFHMQALWFYFKDLPYFWPQLYLLLSFLMRFNFLAKVFYNLLIKILESYSTFTSEIKLDNISLLRGFALISSCNGRPFRRDHSHVGRRRKMSSYTDHVGTVRSIPVDFP